MHRIDDTSTETLAAMLHNEEYCNINERVREHIIDILSDRMASSVSPQQETLDID